MPRAELPVTGRHRRSLHQALHANLVELGTALLNIDADLGEDDIRWTHMRQLRQAIETLPALYASLEDELAAVKS
jgi:hypothetical protein